MTSKRNKSRNNRREHWSSIDDTARRLGFKTWQELTNRLNHLQATDSVAFHELRNKVKHNLKRIKHREQRERRQGY